MYEQEHGVETDIYLHRAVYGWLRPGARPEAGRPEDKGSEGARSENSGAEAGRCQSDLRRTFHSQPRQKPDRRARWKVDRLPLLWRGHGYLRFRSDTGGNRHPG